MAFSINRRTPPTETAHTAPEVFAKGAPGPFDKCIDTKGVLDA